MILSDGLRSCRCWLPVSDSPIITFEPFSPYSVRLGRPANITCQVDANPPVNVVTWQKDRQPLSGKGSSHVRHSSFGA